jgi:hypothetical protein
MVAAVLLFFAASFLYLSIFNYWFAGSRDANQHTYILRGNIFSIVGVLLLAAFLIVVVSVIRMRKPRASG